MAMSGSVASAQSNYYLYVVFDWSVAYDLTTMKATWTISATIKRTSVSGVSNNYATSIEGTTANNYIKFNNTTVWSKAAGYYGSGTSHPYVYTGDKSLCAETTYGPYTGTLSGKYPYGYAHLLKNYKFTTNIDSNGNTSLTIANVFKMNGNTLSALGTRTITPTQADVASKIGNKDNGSWTTNGRIWHKENGTWIKRRLYRKQSDTSGDWIKV